MLNPHLPQPHVITQHSRGADFDLPSKEDGLPGLGQQSGWLGNRRVNEWADCSNGSFQVPRAPDAETSSWTQGCHKAEEG